MRKISVVAIAAVAVLAAGQASAQTTGGDCTRREITVSIPEASGTPGEWPRVEDFHVAVRGRKARVTRIAPEPGKKRLVILLDASGSMFEPQGKWGLARGIARAALLGAGKNVSVALLVFGRTAFDTAPFSESRQQAIATVEGLPEKHKDVPKKEVQTALYDSIEQALQMLREPQPGDAVLAITDGGDNYSRTTESRAKRDLLEHEARLFAAAFPEEPEVPPVSVNEVNHEASLPTNMMDMAEDTGGFVLPVWAEPLTPLAADYRFSEGSRVLLANRLDALVDAVEWTYRIEIKLDRELKKEASLKLKLEPTPGSTYASYERSEGGAVVIYPHRLAACGAK